MRTFYITVAIILLWVIWQLNKPIPKQPQVARAFTDSEVEYLEHSFDYAMNTLAAGKYLDWSAAGVNGRITVGKKYESGKHVTCREYIQVMRTYNAQKVESAIACKRSGKEGWCRVNYGEPESCALEVAESSLIKRGRFAILQGSQIIDGIMGTRMQVNTDALAPSTPNIHAPSMPHVEMPEIEKPDVDINVRDMLPWNGPKKQ